MNYLLKVGASQSLANHAGWTALHRACLGGHAHTTPIPAHPSEVRQDPGPGLLFSICLGLFHESRWPSLVGLSERWLQLLDAECTL